MESPKQREGLYIPKTDRRVGYDYYLDLLDFKPATQVRKEFKRKFIEYHDKPHRKYVRKEDGEKFTALVKGFLKKHGAAYFGEGPRPHLLVTEPSIGLLYPRDANNEGSYLRRIIGDFFQWRSNCVRGGEMTRIRPPSPEVDEPLSSPGSPGGEAGGPKHSRAHRPKRRVRENQDQDHLNKRAKRLDRGAVKSSSPDPSYGKPPRRDSNHVRLARASRRPISPQPPNNLPPRALKRELVDLTVPDVKPVKRETPGLDSEVTSHSARRNTIGTSSEALGLLSKTIMDGNTLSVRVSNQPDVAPAFVNLGLCHDFQVLFPVLVSECEVQAPSTMKITKISVTFPWNREQLRLRKGRPEDWIVFCSAIRRRWQNPEDFEGGVCKVEMIVHVDG